jgi:hypothetical protein
MDSLAAEWVARSESSPEFAHVRLGIAVSVLGNHVLVKDVVT